MYLFVPCDKKSHGTEISFPIRSNRLSHPHPLTLPRSVELFRGKRYKGTSVFRNVLCCGNVIDKFSAFSYVRKD